MRRAWIVAALLVFATGCSTHAGSPESVVRAWSQELNSGDNEGAAELFALGAKVIQGGRVLTLRTHEDAVAWNSALPCSGEIVKITARNDTAVATFVLGDRPSSRCDGPGGRATTLFRILNGKIVLWHQTAGSAAPPSTGTV